MKLLVAMLFAAATVAGCASAASIGSSRDPNRISADEIATAQVTDAYELVERLRPQWLRARPITQSTSQASMGGGHGEIVVFMNGARYGGVESLRQIAPESIGTIRYLGPGEVQREFTGQSGRGVVGAIMIRSAGRQ